MLRKINRHCTARQNRATQPSVELLKTPEPRTVPAEFLKNMVAYPPPPNPYISEKPFSRQFQKGIIYPPYKTRTNGK